MLVIIRLLFIPGSSEERFMDIIKKLYNQNRSDFYRV